MKKLGNWIGVILLVSFLLVGQAVTPAHATGTIRHVTPAGLNSGTCGTWAAACNLQRALSVVAVSGDQVWVKQGTYKPTSGTDRTVSFVLKNNVKIYGGFVGTESALNKRNPKTHVTILSGDIGTPGDPTDNSYHVVAASGLTSSAVLDGFTIKAGNANGSTPNYWGGGLLNNNGSSPALSNLIFSGNSAISGGGMFNITGSSPKLTNVTFSANSASFGGGMYNYSSSPALTNVTFHGNPATNDGGGMYNASSSNPTLRNVTFSGNSANQGGGIYNTSSNPKLTNVTLNGNTASDSGGGMYNSGSSPNITNVTFSGNSASNLGGGIYNDSSSPKLTNVTFSGNKVLSGSAGGMLNSFSSPTLTNTTFSGNSAAFGGGMDNINSSSPVIHDSIFWDDGSEIYNFFSASHPTIEDSIVEGGCPVDANCIGNVYNIDPRLNPLANNGGFTKTMSLGAGSFAIDKGGGITSCALTDQRGVTRPQGPRCDLGAYEVKSLTFISVAAYDGSVLESAKGSKHGGSLDGTATTFRVGDDSSNRRYRGFLSFNTAALPDGAAVVLSTLSVKAAGVVGSPSTNQGVLQADLVKPYFGSSLILVNSDWQAAATVNNVGPFGSDVTWINKTLNSSARSNINKTGSTQFRLRFTSDAYNGLADFFSFYSGSATTASYRPRLIVYYNP